VIASLAEVRRVPEAEEECRVDQQLIDLMQAYERPIYNFLLALLHDADVALDCAQDTFLRAYENLRKGKPVTQSWLYTVARNRAMDEFRRNKRIQPEGDVLDQIAVHPTTESRLAIQSVLAQLSPSDREVLYLFDVAGFRTEEIGRMLGARGTAIRQRLSRARQRFRQLYGTES
jgi:RNA polymerase sigma-70 factor (ECF subfamily)